MALHVSISLSNGWDLAGPGSGFVFGADTEAAHLTRSAFERGIRFFDTANIYGGGERERILVSALQKRRIERL